eukprot:1203014-Pleurochrysis_carterae.AAC.1
MGVDCDGRIERAAAREQELMNKLTQMKQKPADICQYSKHMPMSRDAEAYDELSASARRTARHRDIDYAFWFVEQRQWRADEWIE